LTLGCTRLLRGDPGHPSQKLRALDGQQLQKLAADIQNGRMAESRSIYRGYVLNCRPTPVGDGYQARATIICVASDKTMTQRFLDLEVFATEEDAVERALAAGRDWVDAQSRIYESGLLAPARAAAYRQHG
jgi:hypothetical protein